VTIGVAPPASIALTAQARAVAARRGKRLSRITLAYNTGEGIASIVAGILAGSIALVGFGIDSVIEVISSAASLWRLHSDADPARRARSERTALQVVGWCFLALAAYIALEAGHALYAHEIPERTIPGVVITVLSVIIMPLLARAKRRVAKALGSRALVADATQTSLCAYLSLIVLVGLLLNAALGWWWADPVAALAMVPIIGREGVDGIRAKACDDCC
jgi:divalent metal cation (Fe/Co/Zn/Cd) transporter